MVCGNQLKKLEDAGYLPPVTDALRRGIRGEIATSMSTGIHTSVVFNSGQATDVHVDPQDTPWAMCSVAPFGCKVVGRNRSYRPSFDHVDLAMPGLRLTIQPTVGETVFFPSKNMVHFNSRLRRGEQRWSVVGTSDHALDRVHDSNHGKAKEDRVYVGPSLGQ